MKHAFSRGSCHGNRDVFGKIHSRYHETISPDFGTRARAALAQREGRHIALLHAHVEMPRYVGINCAQSEVRVIGSVHPPAKMSSLIHLF